MDQENKKPINKSLGYLREILITLGLLIFAALQFYNYPKLKALEAKYPKIYDEKLARQSTPQPEALELLLLPITQTTNQDIYQKDLFRKFGSSSSVTYKYKNPSEQIFQTILQEIDRQQIWTPNDKTKPVYGKQTLYIKQFCHQEHTLSISKETMVHGFMLFVNVSWVYDSDCRKLALGYQLD